MTKRTASLLYSMTGLISMLVALFFMIGWKGGLFLTGLVLFIIGVIAYSEYRKEDIEEYRRMKTKGGD